MARRAQVGVAFSFGLATAAVSLPLALWDNSSFGLGGTLLWPALVIGAWFALSARERDRRAWWFGFVLAAGLCLPFAPAIEAGLHDSAVYLQHRAQRGQLALSQRVIEPCCLLLTLICPAAVASVAGVAAGRFTQRVVRRMSRNKAADPSASARWQFSLRELLVALAAVAGLLAWNGRFTADHQATDRQNQQQFLARFKESFRSGQVKLCKQPAIVEHQGALASTYLLSFNAPGVNEYRIIAPIEKNGVRRWAVWAYTCNQEAQEMIYQYGYAEAKSDDQLPQSPLPPKRYVEGTWELVDGVPSTDGPLATVVSVAAPEGSGEPCSLTARAPAGTICEFAVFPRTAATSSLARQAPDENGLVRWSWTPDFGGPFQYELRCIDQRASGRMVGVRRGTIP